MNKDKIGILYVYGPQGKSCHLMLINDIPAQAVYSTFNGTYSLNHV